MVKVLICVLSSSPVEETSRSYLSFQIEQDLIPRFHLK